MKSKINKVEKSILPFVLLVFSILTIGCRGSTGNTSNRLVVTEIVDGNKVRVTNGKVYGLIGISPDEDSKAVLTKELVNEEITYQYDTRFSSFSDVVYVYVNRTRDKKPINRLVLNTTNGELNTKFLFDSLGAYKNSFDNELAMAGSGANGNNNVDNGSSANIVEVIKKAEKGVFLVITKDEWGNKTGTGTGFFITRDGIGLSNHHVFEGGSSWTIKLVGGESFEVTDILSQSPENDFIVFRVDVGSLGMAALGLGSGDVHKAEEIFVLGNPKGLESVLTKGVISSPSKDYRGIDLIQIDAAVSPGNSGSPVMKSDGEVIGVATLKFNDCENCNFAINIDDVKKALRSKRIDYNEHR